MSLRLLFVIEPCQKSAEAKGTRAGGMLSNQLTVWSRLYAAAGPAVVIVPSYAIIVLIDLALFSGSSEILDAATQSSRPAPFGSSYQKAGWSTTPTTEDPADAR